MLLASSLLTALWLAVASASVTVRRTHSGPTGYEVDFLYYNATAVNVTIGGGIPVFTDQWHTSAISSANIDPRDFQAGQFPASITSGTTPYVMTSDGNGTWRYTTPFPSGTFAYAFLVDCPNPLGYPPPCGIDSGRYVIDPDNPPFVNVQGDQIQSIFQVPYDATFQNYPDFSLDFSYTLPVDDEEHRGSVFTVNYTSPGSVHPAQDIHEFAIYLPKEYGTIPGKKYPILYLSHGGGGNGEDWVNLAAAPNILDRLILNGDIVPTVVVMPSFYNLAEQYNYTYGIGFGSVPPSDFVRENYMEYLFPWVESHFDVSSEPSMRAFAGLSLGGLLTYEMYINATSYFDYYGMFSGVMWPGSPYIDAAMVAANPALAEKGLYLEVGLFDLAFDNVRSLQVALDTTGIDYQTRVAPFGFHSWPIWQDSLWNFGQRTLWKPIQSSSTAA